MRRYALALLMLAGCVESTLVLGPDDAGIAPEIDAQVPRVDGAMPASSGPSTNVDSTHPASISSASA